jgi:hypothetical protein
VYLSQTLWYIYDVSTSDGTIINLRQSYSFFSLWSICLWSVNKSSCYKVQTIAFGLRICLNYSQWVPGETPRVYTYLENSVQIRCDSEIHCAHLIALCTDNWLNQAIFLIWICKDVFGLVWYLESKHRSSNCRCNDAMCASNTHALYILRHCRKITLIHWYLYF